MKQKIVNLNSMAKILSNILGKDLDKKNPEEFKTFKKKMKLAYKREFPTYKKRYPKQLVNRFKMVSKDGESFTNVFVFKNENNILESIYNNLNVHGDKNHYDYSPTGRWFAEPAKILVFDERVFFIQTVILDC